MRVIAGEFRSRPLATTAGLATRPTSDRLRETLFNVLASRRGIDGLNFADLYAGSGSVGIEAISRGARHSWFVEESPPALAALKKNLAALGIGNDRATLVASNVTAFLKKWPQPCDIIFLDPPYEDAAAYSRCLHALGSDTANAMLAPHALVIAEHSAKGARKKIGDLAESYGNLHRTRLLEQSDAALSFYELRKD
jgi:16S rRNA (guanine(966)-N(2))-methyltransferase RsmD